MVHRTFDFDRRRWATKWQPELRRWEDVEIPEGKRADQPVSEQRRMRTVRLMREQLVYEAMADGIPTAVIADELGMTCEGVRQRARRYARRKDVAMPQPPRYEKRRSSRRTYAELVSSWGVLMEAWYEPLNIARELGDPAVGLKVAYYARQAGLPYKAIAQALGYSNRGMSRAIERYAETKGLPEPRKEAAVTARGGLHRQQDLKRFEPSDWLMDEVRAL